MVPNSGDEEEVPEPQVESQVRVPIYHEEEEDEDEDLEPDTYPTKKKTEKAAAQSKKRALAKVLKDAEVSHSRAWLVSPDLVKFIFDRK